MRSRRRARPRLSPSDQAHTASSARRTSTRARCARYSALPETSLGGIGPVGRTLRRLGRGSAGGDGVLDAAGAQRRRAHARQADLDAAVEARRGDADGRPVLRAAHVLQVRARGGRHADLGQHVLRPERGLEHAGEERRSPGSCARRPGRARRSRRRGRAAPSAGRRRDRRARPSRRSCRGGAPADRRRARPSRRAARSARRAAGRRRGRRGASARRSRSGRRPRGCSGAPPAGRRRRGATAGRSAAAAAG